VLCAVAGAACTTLLPGSDRSTDGSMDGSTSYPGDPDSGGPQDAGLDEAIDATVDFDGGGDAAAEASLSALAAYCQLAGPAAVDCGTVPAECEGAWLAFCSSLGELLSPSYIQAQIACTDPTSCSAQVQDCGATSIADASPTTAQSLLAQDYCATCSIGAEACDALGYSFGSINLFAYSDSVARSIDGQCTGAALESWVQSSPLDQNADCVVAFADCENAVVVNSASTLPSWLPGCVLDGGPLTGGSDAAPIDADVACFPGNSRAPLLDAGLCDDGGPSAGCAVLAERCEAGVERRVACTCGVCTCTVNKEVVATVAQSSCPGGCCVDQCPF
jgi:hypothetical protein